MRTTAILAAVLVGLGIGAATQARANDISPAGTPAELAPIETPRFTTPVTAPVTVRGEVVETGCFVIGNRRGPRHRQCAIASSRAGQDLGIVDQETGILYVEIREQEHEAAASQLVAHVARQVEVRGRIFRTESLQGITIDRVRELD